jgi:hypothetical protein
MVSSGFSRDNRDDLCGALLSLRGLTIGRSKTVDEILNSSLEESKACRQAQVEAKALFRLLNYCPPPLANVSLLENPADPKVSCVGGASFKFSRWRPRYLYPRLPVLALSGHHRRVHIAQCSEYLWRLRSEHFEQWHVGQCHSPAYGTFRWLRVR